MSNWHLESLEITGGFLAGLALRLPRGLVCVIGPRGSGKSTLAEAIRYVFGAAPGGSRSVRELVQANLAEAIITARTAAGPDGAVYVVRRSLRQAPVLSSPDGSSVLGIDLERGTFLPLDVYSSNEIEAIADQSLGERRRALLDDLRAAELAEIQLAVAGHRRALDANRDAIRAARALVASLGEQIEELADAPVKLAALPPSPAGEGLADLTRATRQQQANEREDRALLDAKQLVDRLRGESARLAEALAAAPGRRLAPEGSSNTALLIEAESLIAAAVHDALPSLAAAIEALERAVKALPEVQARLSEIHATHRAELSQLEQHNLLATQAVQARAAAERAVARLDELEVQRHEVKQRFVKLSDERKELRGVYLLARERVSEIRDEIARSLQHQAGAKVRVRVLRNADTLTYQQLLTDGLQGARVKNHDQILAGLLRLRPEDLAQLLEDNDAAEFERQTGLVGERARKILEAFREKLDPMELELVPTDDQVCIELNVASAAEPNFKEASALSRGQKCTALLPLLLARRDSPLVVDQPEDNLDNHFIYETVVETILRLKHSRQMIFVTHNANIPVLAEADLVIVMDSDGRTGYVRKAGSLDECRDEIIRLLEGGREAFELRRRRYGDP